MGLSPPPPVTKSPDSFLQRQLNIFLVEAAGMKKDVCLNKAMVEQSANNEIRTTHRRGQNQRTKGEPSCSRAQKHLLCIAF